MHCVKCGAALPVGAGFCSNCGAAVNSQEAQAVAATVGAPSGGKPKSSPGCLKIGLGVVMGFVALGVIGNLLPKSGVKKVEATQNGAAEIENGADLPIAVSAKDLFNAYQSNEASAQSYFGKRKLLVSGTVDKVALDFLDDPEVLLRTPNQFMSAHAALADDAKDRAGEYSPGDAVKLLCEDVSEAVSIPMLKDCRPAAKDQKSQPVQWNKK